MRFEKQKNMKNHNSINTDKTPYPCHNCDKRLEKLKNVKNDMMIKSVNCDRNPFPCQYCDKRFCI